MRVINIDYERYYYPEEKMSLADFIEVVNKNQNQFIQMKKYNEDNCVFPYLISEEFDFVYLNFSAISKIHEEEAYVLSKKKYDEKLATCVSEKCLDCTNYEEDKDGDNMVGHRDKLCLDGTCRFYQKK